MRTLRIIVIALGFICLPVLAIAENCTSQYVMMPDGRSMICTTCCNNGACYTNCW